ncbi:MAG: sensor domain-containing diguanylate cyclase [Clostridia bacterium]|nr:sensor domain-containing diguanylate cyclase [Clostridia bacterium]
MGKVNKIYILIEAAVMAALAISAAVFVIVFYYDLRIIATGVSIFFAVFVVIKVLFLFFIYNNNYILLNNEELINNISDSISGGKVRFRLDDGLTLIYASPKFLTFTGYSREEIKQKFQDKYINMVEESYRLNVLNVLKHQSIETSKSQIFYKLTCAGGSKEVINMYALMSGKKVAQNFLIDPSSIKHLQTEKDIDAERYRIVAEQSESIIFDFNNVDKTIYINSYFKDKFGYEPQGNLFEFIKTEKIVFDEDMDRFMQLSVCDRDYNEIEVRLKKLNGEYIWCKLRITTLRNEEKQPIRLIGKIIDVDESRKEKQKLIEKARRDDMTGMYNKLSTEQFITSAIQEGTRTGLSAFLLFDIDNFKQINDKFGHMQGDAVLYQICDDLRLIFRSTDILGRIGGDEFVVFIRNISSEEHAIKKARDILDLIENKYSEEKDGFVVSVSVGISFFEKDGNTYKELFVKADKALYEAKNKGKNTFEVYNPS